MSTIHKYRITDYSVKERSTKEIFNYCFGFSDEDFSFEDWLDRLRVNTDSAEMDFDKFFSILSENYSHKGLSFFDLIFRLYNNEFNHLKENNNSGEIINLTSAEALLWYHIFADLSIDGFSKFPLKELKIEIAQIEDGIVTLPNVDEKIFWGEQYREFLIRLLSNLPDSTPSHFPIAEWFEKNDADLFDNFITNTEIIWGVKEEARILITDNNSWENYNHHWWKDLLQKTVEYKIQHNGENWINTLQEYPLEMVTVNVLIHNSWFPNIEDLIKNEAEFDSTAYFVE
ncbi:hypothetical protein OF897_20345 [Chryseobacterium formosus]|uniref:Uncharacterized protein n=1 Tax=Chryseobacterium formosus TaxID=1537363 RepID=A0ABT3XX74_9FLAO|nr:hypothetical protein [Chryseobacterium formosus]MCX8526271.1 hypothetical protein [Chryseobacterium formosus]